MNKALAKTNTDKTSLNKSASVNNTDERAIIMKNTNNIEGTCSSVEAVSTHDGKGQATVLTATQIEIVATVCGKIMPPESLQFMSCRQKLVLNRRRKMFLKVLSDIKDDFKKEEAQIVNCHEEVKIEDLLFLNEEKKRTLKSATAEKVLSTISQNFSRHELTIESFKHLIPITHACSLTTQQKKCLLKKLIIGRLLYPARNNAGDNWAFDKALETTKRIKEANRVNKAYRPLLFATPISKEAKSQEMLVA